MPVEALELVVVQFEECERLLKVPRIPHQRLALILIDNLVEVILAHKVQSELFRNTMYADIVEFANRYPESPEPDFVSEARAKFITKSKEKDLEYSFIKKIDFLIERSHLDSELGQGMKKLHLYRNETYHQDRLRERTLAAAVRIYFDMACSLLSGYFDPAPMYWRVWSPDEFAQTHPAAARYATVQLMGTLSDVPAAIATKFRANLALHVESLRSELIEYLHERIDELDNTLTQTLSNMLYADSWKRADVLRSAQFRQTAPADFNWLKFTLETMRGRRYKYRERDLSRWREEASALASLTERNAMFAAFAQIEDDFEPCFEAVHEFAVEVEIALQQAIDEYRGK